MWLIDLVKSCLSLSSHARPAHAGELPRELTDFQESALRLANSDMLRFFELSPDLLCIAGCDGCFRNRYLRRDGSILHLEWVAKSVVSEALTYAMARDVSPRLIRIWLPRLGLPRTRLSHRQYMLTKSRVASFC